MMFPPQIGLMLAHERQNDLRRAAARIHTARPRAGRTMRQRFGSEMIKIGERLAEPSAGQPARPRPRVL